MVRFLLTLFTIFFIGYNSYSQYGFGFDYVSTLPRIDYSPIQITGMPLQYLPSFAGNLGQVRIGMEYQRSKAVIMQRRIVNTSYMGISVDGFISKLSSGLGVFVSREENTAFSPYVNNQYYQIGVAFAPKISLKGKYTFSPGISVIHDVGKVDMHYYMGGMMYGTSREATSRTYSQTISLLFNTKKMYIGAGFNSMIGSLAYWNFMLQMGATFQRSDESRFSFSPSILWLTTHDGKFYNNSIAGLKGVYFPANVNLNFRYQKILFGAGLYGFMAGFQNRNFRIIYTTNADLSRNTITLRILFNNKNNTTSGGM